MSAILFSGSSELLPATRQKIVNFRETLKQDKLTCWFWFNSRGVNLTDFYGKTISISGCGYNDSAASVFFSFIVPFLQDAIVKTLDETLEICRTRGLKPEEPYIRETAMLLDGHLIDPIYRYMATIDRRIRGRGYPKKVGRKGVTDKITEMVRFLDKCKDEMIQGIKEPNRKNRKIFGDKFELWGFEINYKNLWHKVKNWLCVTKIIKTIRNFRECKQKKLDQPTPTPEEKQVNNETE